MNDPESSKYTEIKAKNDHQISKFSNGGVHVREDDQDWGSSGMNDIKKDSE